MNFDLAPLQFLRERLNSRRDTEHAQAILRIGLLGVIFVSMWARSLAPTALADGAVLRGLGAFLFLAILIFTAICIWPAPSVPRRVLGMVVDVGATTWAMFLSGEAGVGLIGVYLFIIFGNGFRYGHNHLLVSQGLSLAGFGIGLLFAPWWQENPEIGWGLMMTLLIIPNYVGMLTKRLMQNKSSQSA